MMRNVMGSKISRGLAFSALGALLAVGGTGCAAKGPSPQEIAAENTDQAAARAEAAALRANQAAERAEVAADKAEAIFKKNIRK
ncbi:MAG: hypothetical protein VCC00_14220 [Deltaproteobacteria bacterium]